MAETRVIIGHAQHPARGPHLELPADFVPLRLAVLDTPYSIEVRCPSAIVGRHTDADLRFACPDVSRRHCRFVFENGQWRIHDLKSLNGLFVNNVPILEATLYPGDQIRLGAVQLLVESGTRLQRTASDKHEKLRQIVDLLPPKRDSD